MFQIDPNYKPEEVESRDVFGITIKQKRNNLRVSDDMFSKVLALNGEITPQIIADLKLGVLTLKYTMSNSICVVNNGHVIGIGSGQQSRILCSNLALSKANVWYQKMLLDYSFLKDHTDLKRTDLDQIVEQKRQEIFSDKIELNKLPNTCLLSDGFFPQKDNIELANKYGVKYIAAPTGSIRDKEIIETANKYGITLIDLGVRLFHH
jgi:phosphoribosylaminoimidazolecarboxamide formyltransferase/IMP cyclohydrolase